MDYGIFFGVPFAESGDKVEIPVESQPSNAVSFTSGYTLDYALNITTDPRAKSIERTKANYLSWAITSALGGLQRFGAPSWVGPSDNGGVPLAYPKGARVQSGLLYYVSMIENNTRALTDTTAWSPATFVPATGPEGMAGTATDLIITPSTLRYVLQNTSIGQPASLTVAGVTRYATAAETTAGAVTNAAVTPAGLKPALDAKLNATLPAAFGPMSVQPLGGNFGVLEVLRHTAGNTPGTKAYDITLQGDNALRLSSYDANGTNGVPVLTTGLYNADASQVGVSTAGDLTAGRNLIAAGRVTAGQLATEAMSSTTRLSTAAEMNAGAVSVAASPAQVVTWANARFLPISQPRATTSLSVPGSDSGLLWYRVGAGGGQSLFFTNAMAGAGEQELSFNGCKDDGTWNRTVLTMNRITGRVQVPYDLNVVGQISGPLANQSYASVVRMATDAEVSAAAATEIAVSPITLARYVQARYLPLSGGTVSGPVNVSHGAQGSQIVGLRVGWAGVAQSFAIAVEASQETSFYTYDKGATTTVRMKLYPPGMTTGAQISGGLRVLGAGDFTGNTVFAGNFQSTSRRSKKNIISEITPDEAFAQLAKYRAHWGTWKDGELAGDAGHVRAFLIADEVAAHSPGAVGFDDDGEAGSVDYTADVPTLITAVNALRTMVSELQDEVRRLREGA